MAKKKYKKKNTAGKVIAGLSIGTILCGATAGVIYTLEQNPVSASQPQEGTSDIVNDDLQNKIDELEQSKTELQTKIDKLTSDKTALEATILENQANIGSLNSQIANLDAEISALRSEKLELGTTNEELADLIENLENERASLQIELSLKEEALNNLQLQVSILNQQLAELNKGSYSIKLENESLNITYEDLSSLSRYSSIDWLVGNISSTLGDQSVPYEYSISGLDHNTNTAKILFYNGSAENGDYAIMTLNVDKNRNEYIVKYNNSFVGNYIFLNVGDKISLSDFQLEKNTYLFDRTASVRDVQVSTADGWFYLSSGDYTLSEEKEYTVWVINEFGNWTQIYISTYPGIIKNENSIIYNSGEWDNSGNYIVSLTLGEETGTITIKNNYFEEFNLNQTNFLGQNIITSDNWQHQIYNSGGLGTVTTCVNDSNNNNYYITFYEDKLAELYNYYVNNFSEDNNLGIAVKNIAYFENGKGFDDTPEVTAMYEEGQYIVFEFNAFGQVKNKLYLCLGDGQGYVELGDGDRQTAVVSLESNSDEEAVLNIGYALPGTQLHITIVPTK